MQTGKEKGFKKLVRSLNMNYVERVIRGANLVQSCDFYF